MFFALLLSSVEILTASTRPCATGDLHRLPSLIHICEICCETKYFISSRFTLVCHSRQARPAEFQLLEEKAFTRYGLLAAGISCG